MSSEIKAPKLRKPASLEKRRARSGYMFVAPFIIGIFLIYIPILLDSVWFSFNHIASKWDVETNSAYQELEFVGWQYYNDAIGNQDFITNLLGGIQEIVLKVPAIIIFALFIAVVLNQKMLGRAAFRAIFFVPVIISTGIMDSINAADKMTNMDGTGTDDGTGESGASQIISILDVEKLFGSMKVGGELVTYVVQLVNEIYSIINYSGVQMLIFLAGLQSISPAIYEACRIDGATGWETFWKITFPMISPMILVNAIYTVIDTFTRSSNVTMSYIATIYKGSRETATAMSWIYFLVVILIIAVVAGIASTFIFYQRRD